tara:strand:- start:86216 stop:88651 length:2436 start_codon:yes stop_codon:yes gene_type:complete
MKRMLINATQEEEIRVAMVDGQYLYNLDIESTAKVSTKANIYKGKISRIEPSLEAAFVEYGGERHGFLPLKEIAPSYHKSEAEPGKRMNIKDLVKEGQEIIVQVEKEERGAKGAALTTFITLAGCYLVVMPNNPKAGGISRRIESTDRGELRDILNNLNAPEDMGVIVRTAGVGKSGEELQWDLDSLLKQWNAIQKASEERGAPFLIYQESDIISRCVRDNLRDDIGELVIDSPKIYNKAKEYIEAVRPEFASKVSLYSESAPLFNRYQIERQIESAFQREVQLPSGGSIVIDNTEALISIDINSARATRGSDIEATALNTNLEAADEIARQLRMRDAGGLIVIDFIDMGPVRNQREVENRLRDGVASDRARIQTSRISRFGLLEMSRQRLRPSLREGTQHVCPRCSGNGMIRGVESLSLAILRLIEEEAEKELGCHVRTYVPLNVATYLMNEKKEHISQIEHRNTVKVYILPSIELETPHYKIERVKAVETKNLKEKLSYDIEYKAETEESIDDVNAPLASQKIEQPAVSRISPEERPTTKAATNKPGLFVRLYRALFGTGDSKPSNSRHSRQRQGNSNQRYQNNRNQQNNNRRTNNNGRNQSNDRRQTGQQRDGQQTRGNNQQRNRQPRDEQQRTPRQPRDEQQRNRQPRDDQQRTPRQPRNRQPRDEQQNTKPREEQQPSNNAAQQPNTTQPRSEQPNRDDNDSQRSRQPRGNNRGNNRGRNNRNRSNSNSSSTVKEVNITSDAPSTPSAAPSVATPPPVSFASVVHDTHPRPARNAPATKPAGVFQQDAVERERQMQAQGNTAADKD